MVASTLKLGIAILNGGNSTVQQVSLPALYPENTHFCLIYMFSCVILLLLLFVVVLARLYITLYTSF